MIHEKQSLELEKKRQQGQQKSKRIENWSDEAREEEGPLLQRVSGVENSAISTSDTGGGYYRRDGGGVSWLGLKTTWVVLLSVALFVVVSFSFSSLTENSGDLHQQQHGNEQERRREKAVVGDQKASGGGTLRGTAAMREGMMMGGFRTVDDNALENDEGLKESLKKVEEKATEIAGRPVKVELLKAESQVVAGTNYRMIVHVEDSALGSNYYRSVVWGRFFNACALLMMMMVVVIEMLLVVLQPNYLPMEVHMNSPK